MNKKPNIKKHEAIGSLWIEIDKEKAERLKQRIDVGINVIYYDFDGSALIMYPIYPCNTKYAQDVVSTLEEVLGIKAYCLGES